MANNNIYLLPVNRKHFSFQRKFDILKMPKGKNAYFIIRDKEYCTRNNIRFNLKVIKTLICDKEAKFKKIWEKHDKKPIMYEGGQLYFDNYRTCYTINGCAKSNFAQQLYKLPPVQNSQKIEDCLICHAQLEHLPLQSSGYKSTFLALTADNWLIRFDLNNGEILQKVFLSRRHKFRHIAWDTAGYTFALRSTQTKMSEFNRQAGIVPNFLMTIALFKVFPLEFIGMLNISKSIFGKDITDAMVGQGFLITMHQGGLIKMYGIDDILRLGRKKAVKLYEKWEDTGEDVGSYPHGVPLNIELNECPKLLFEVKCAEHHLVMGGIPWHYIICPPGTQGYFKVFSLGTKKMAIDGCLNMDTISVVPDKCFFHADDSGRILYWGGKEIRLLKLSATQCPSMCQITEDFTIKPLLTAEENPKQEPDWHISSSGRIIKRMSSYHQHNGLIDTTDEEPIQTVDYENDLDLITATSLHSTEDGNTKGTLCIYNNWTGKLLKTLPIEEEWKEFHDHVVTLDLDTFVHMVKGPMRKYSCYVYRLDRQLNEESKGEKIPGRRKSKRASRDSHKSEACNSQASTATPSRRSQRNTHSQPSYSAGHENDIDEDVDVLNL